MKKSKILVVYYSRTGNTRKVAEEMAGNLKADLCGIKAKSDYRGFFGYIRAGYQAVLNKKPEIRIDKNTGNYDMIIIGTPNWGSRMASPVRTFVLSREFNKLKIAFFCCQGGSGAEKLLDRMEKLTKKPVAKFFVNQRDIKDNSYKNKVKEFCGRLG
ncbi:MAG: hypothetical protein AABX54_00370 [Nanoarchaeota archaeon]